MEKKPDQNEKCGGGSFPSGAHGGGGRVLARMERNRRQTFQLMLSHSFALHPYWSEPGCRPQAPLAEGGPGGLADGGNRRDWFPRGPGGEGGIQARSEIVNLFIAFTSDRIFPLSTEDAFKRSLWD